LCTAKNTTGGGGLLPGLRAGRRGDVLLASAPPQLQLEAVLAPGHRPPVVGREERSQREAAVPEERFLGGDPPVVGNLDEVAILVQRPHPSALEVAVGDQLEP